jgi:hypothetical protein
MTQPRLTSLAEHPAASASIRRMKAYGGIGGYGIALGAGLMHGAALEPALEHAVAAGVVAYLLTWAAAVATWRRVLAGHATAALRRARAAQGATE